MELKKTIMKWFNFFFCKFLIIIINEADFWSQLTVTSPLTICDDEIFYLFESRCYLVHTPNNYIVQPLPL